MHPGKDRGEGAKEPSLWWLHRVEFLETKFAMTRKELERRFMLPEDLALEMLSSYPRSVRYCTAMLPEGQRILQSDGQQPIPNQFEEVPSAPTVGMEMVLALVKQVVEDDALGIIGIYEMNGIVKTVLSSKFHNGFLADSIHLDMVIFIYSYRDLDVQSIQNKIHQWLGLLWKNR